MHSLMTADRTTRATPRAESRRDPFLLLSALLSAWLIAGAYLDGWAHNNLLE